jgi:hypothetical protein
MTLALGTCPVTWKSGPLGRMSPAAEATAAVGDGGTAGLLKPGTQDDVTLE